MYTQTYHRFFEDMAVKRPIYVVFNRRLIENRAATAYKGCLFGMPILLVRMATPGAKIYVGQVISIVPFPMEIRKIHLIMADCGDKSSLSAIFPRIYDAMHRKGWPIEAQTRGHYFAENVLKFVLFNENEASINSNIDFVPNRRQAII